MLVKLDRDYITQGTLDIWEVKLSESARQEVQNTQWESNSLTIVW